MTLKVDIEKMKNFEINIPPISGGISLKVNGQEIRGLSRISFTVAIDATETGTESEIILEFEGMKTNESGDFVPRSLEDGLQVLDIFTQKVRVYSAFINGNLNDYPIGG